jgi:transposase InsO family protein/transposase-like protein
MRYTEEQKAAALDNYFSRGRGIARTCKELGYPSHETLRDWINADPRVAARPMQKNNIMYTMAFKLNAVQMMVDGGVPAKRLQKMLGEPNESTLYSWKRLYEAGGAAALMDTRDIRRAKAAGGGEPPGDVEELRRGYKELYVENLVLKETINVLKKGPCVDPAELSNKEKAAVVDALRKTIPLKTALDALGLAASSYHYQRNASLRPDKLTGMRKAVRRIFANSKGIYGSERIWLALRGEGVKLSEKVVRRIMKEEGLVACYVPKKLCYNSYAGEATAAPDNFISRDFKASAPNEKWLTDFTEMKAADGKVYLSPIIDCFDGAVVAYARGTSPNAELANTMLEMAGSGLGEGEHPILHSDRGGPYRWPGWIALTERYGIVRSMSAKGCSPDNAACEGFFGRLKVEMYHGRGWQQRPAAELMAAIDEYIEWYNTKRIKKSLGGLSPLQYRQSLGLAA